ncbi:MAG: hypothetical protein QG646_251 [Euryarchaeota archaeon]|nr:hypothetical protein [Euryarchaeota archaeon]
MKIMSYIASLGILIIFAQNVIAVETNTTPIQYDSFTEIAGKNIADSQAENWSNDARLIRITIPNSTLVNNQGKIEYYTSEYSYLYRSNDRYLDVLINFTEYEKGSARTKEFSREDAKKYGLSDKKPLSDTWKVVSWNAFKIASNSYNMSYDRGDIISRMYFEAAEIDNTIVPVWNVSIRDGITGLDTSYTINANTADIVYLNSINEPIKIDEITPSGTNPPSVTSTSPIEENSSVISSLMNFFFSFFGILASLATILSAYIAYLAYRDIKHKQK